MSNQGTCEHCAAAFTYDLWHTGFSDMAYAYCERCGRTATLDGWKAPKSTRVRIHQAISEEAEDELAPCECGGRFRRNACPRCPTCGKYLSPERATAWIEANAAGTTKGWRWQRTWTGIYVICIDKRSVKDPWRMSANVPEQ